MGAPSLAQREMMLHAGAPMLSMPLVRIQGRSTRARPDAARGSAVARPDSEDASLGSIVAGPDTLISVSGNFHLRHRIVLEHIPHSHNTQDAA